MTSDQCPVCRARVNPADKDAVFAVKLERVEKEGLIAECVESDVGQYFHGEHFGLLSGYRVKHTPDRPHST